MNHLPDHMIFTLLEPGPVVLITTHDRTKANIMTISWTMVRSFSGEFAITTGAWNYSWQALLSTKECVIAIPTVDLLDKTVGIGTCSGAHTDKFSQFALTAKPAKHVRAPLIRECIANVECRVTEVIERLDLVLLQSVEAYYDDHRAERRTIHAVGDGTFRADGAHFNRRQMMRSKLPYEF